MTEPTGCDHQDWEHELFDGCPPPSPPRECCGTTDWDRDAEQLCSNGRCTVWYCLCGVHSGMSAGPVLCGCKEDVGKFRYDPSQRPMYSVPNGPLLARKRRARQGRP